MSQEELTEVLEELRLDDETGVFQIRSKEKGPDHSDLSFFASAIV